MGTGHTVSVRSQEQGSAWGGEAAPACCPPGSPFLTPPALGVLRVSPQPSRPSSCPTAVPRVDGSAFWWVLRDASSVCLQDQHQTILILILILTAVPTTQPSPAAPCGAVHA